MFRGTGTRILWDDRTRLVQSTVGKLVEFRINAKKVNKEQIVDYLGKTVEGYVKWNVFMGQMHMSVKIAMSNVLLLVDRMEIDCVICGCY